MLGRTKYAGAVGMLLTLACGPRVEIGHGNAGSQGGSAGLGEGGAIDTGATAGKTAGGTDGAGDASAGGAATEGGSSSTVGGTGVTGPIPPDNGPQAEVGKVDLLLGGDGKLEFARKYDVDTDPAAGRLLFWTGIVSLQ